jgi:ERCC4-type nuclease
MKKIKIKIDAREKALIPLIQGKIVDVDFLSISVENLCLGDIHFIHEETDKELVIIERKSLSDLAASIKDGRYNEQSYRLDGHPVHNHNIVYLIEGNATVRPDKHTIYSCLFSLGYRKGFSVWRTISLDETAQFICNSAKYLAKMEPLNGYFLNLNDSTNEGECVETTENETATEYVNVIKSVKKENITPNNIGEIMLSQIPGVSANAAIAIMKKFKHITHLIADLQEEGEKCLEDIRVVGEKNGKERKLTKTCISNIVAFLV